MIDMIEFRRLPIEQKFEQLNAMTAELTALQDEAQRKLDSPETIAFNLAFKQMTLTLTEALAQRKGRLLD